VDRIGSVIAETDASGAVLNKFAFSPFGESSSVSSSNLGYTGQRFDSEVGLYNYKMRYYSPSIGRFLQPDPLGYDGGDLNLYSYVGNDVLNATDSMGLQAAASSYSYTGNGQPWPWIMPTGTNGIQECQSQIPFS
jgi:RHS repeat-associated protein